ncbi:MAG TPA: hypothetical protein VEK76_05565 [Candidatus Binatia bacterium]|nr:hypothetical protein [Candidatus Binatia bacterium]
MLLAPTRLEWLALRRCLAANGPAPGIEVIRCGVGMRRYQPPSGTRSALITCGLAGGLRPELIPGTVVVASSVAMEDGEPVGCDPAWVGTLTAGVRSLGIEPVVGPMVTVRRLAVGPERVVWAARGFAAADMETALIAPTGAPLGSLRVILDAPSREVSAGWSSPRRAGVDPRRWSEMAWLARRAPAYALLAGRCLAAGLAVR